MKLPGINYQFGVQSLGRHDDSAPGREWSAKSRADIAEATASIDKGLAKSSMISATISAADKAYTDVASAESIKGLNAYNEAMLRFENEAQYYDDDGNPAYTNGNERYASAEQAARAAAAEVMTTPRSSEFFDKKADELNVRYQAQWESKVSAWKLDDDRTNAYANMDAMLEAENWEMAQLANDEMRMQNLIDEKSHYANSKKIELTQVETNIFRSIDNVSSPQEANAIRNKINNTKILSLKAREQYKSQLDAQLIENEMVQTRQILSVALENSPEKASVMAQAIYDNARISASEKATGVSAEQQERRINSIQSVAADFIMKAKGETTRQGRMDRLQNWDFNKVKNTHGSTEERQFHDDYVAAYAYGWMPDNTKTGYIKDGGLSNGEILSDSPEGQTARATAVQHFNITGVINDPTQEVIDAAFASPEDTDLRSGVEMIAAMSHNQPGVRSLEKLPNVTSDYIDIIQTFPESPEFAMSLIKRHRATSGVDRMESGKAFDAEKYDSDQIGKLVKKQMPEIGMVWDSQPSYKNVFEQKVQNRARELMPFVNNNIDVAYKTAMTSVAKEYGTDQALGKVVTKPFQSNVPHADFEDGEWMYDAIKTDVFEAQGLSPDTDYEYYPVKDFDPVTNPSYFIGYLDEENGEYKISKITMDIHQTPAGKRMADEQAKELEMQFMEAENAKKRERFKRGDIDHIDESLRNEIDRERVGSITSGLTTATGMAVDILTGTAQQVIESITPEKAPSRKKRSRKDYTDVDKSQSNVIPKKYREN